VSTVAVVLGGPSTHFYPNCSDGWRTVSTVSSRYGASSVWGWRRGPPYV